VRSEAFEGLDPIPDIITQDYGIPVEAIKIVSSLRSKGHGIVYLPAAEASVSLDRGGTSLAWQFNRAFTYGVVIAESNSSLELYPTTWLDQYRAQPAVQYFELGMIINLYCGQLLGHYEHARELYCKLLRARIVALNCTDITGMLSTAALSWLKRIRRANCAPAAAGSIVSLFPDC
jgi:hypothetical protein